MGSAVGGFNVSADRAAWRATGAATLLRQPNAPKAPFMRGYDTPLVAAAVALSGIAGFVDAIVFADAGFFASFMSGNSTRLGVGLGEGPSADAVVAGALVLAFLGGVVASSVVARVFDRRRKPAVLLTVAGLLAAAALGVGTLPERLVLLIAAMAMGALNGVFARDGEVTIGLTYMTGSLVKLGQGLAGALMGDADRWGWLRYLALWSGFVAGAVIGASAFVKVGLTALWAGAIVTAIMALVIGALAGSGGERTSATVH
jgi:uncharacterized membrane protein YoaK (UPF0700 family)